MSFQPTTGVTAGYGYTPTQQPVQFPPGGMQQAAPAMSSIVLQPEQQMKLRKELDVTQQNCKVFSEMLTELKPGQASTQDMELLNVSRIIAMIQGNTDTACKSEIYSISINYQLK